MNTAFLPVRPQPDASLATIRTLALCALLTFPAVLPAQNNLADHFRWEPVPAAVQVGEPFEVAVQACDLADQVVTSHGGTAAFVELVPAPGDTLLITEVETVLAARIEMSNVSTNAIDLGGWRVVFYDGLSWPAPRTAFTIPPGTLCPALGVFQLRSGGAFPGSFPNFDLGVSLRWSTLVYSQAAAAILDPAGNVVDFFCVKEAHAAQISVPAPIGGAWSGTPVPAVAAPLLTYQRTGHANHRNAADWLASSNSFGLWNPGLVAPLTPGSCGTALQPAVITFTNGLWSGLVRAPAPGRSVLLRVDDGRGLSGQSSRLDVNDWSPLRLQVPAAASKATPGILGSGAVILPQPASSNVLVSLASSLPGSIQVPGVVTIPVGATNVGFPVTNLDNGLVEGPRPASILASASGFAPATAVLTNYDRPGVSLAVGLPSSVAETATWSTAGEVRVNVPPAANVAVRLESSHPGRIWVPDFVLLPAGHPSAAFGFGVIDNGFIDRNQPVTIAASVPGWTTGQGQVIAVDDESTALSLTITYGLDEGGGTLTNAGSVSIRGLVATNLTIRLTSALPARLQVPATIIIPAGQKTNYFDVTVLDNSLAEGDQVVFLTANADGFQSVTRSALVIDNELAGYGFAALPDSVMADEPFQVTVYARNLSGTSLAGYGATLSLKATNAAGALHISPSQAGPFTNGVWTGLVTLSGAGPGVSLAADDGLGHAGASAAFELVAGRRLNLALSDLVYDAARARLWAAVQTGGAVPAQSVVPIDPVTGAMGAPIPLGNTPGKLALSDDARFLYVALMTTGGVARIHLDAGAVDLRFALPPGTNTFATELAVPPGDPHALLLQMRGSSAATALWRDGLVLTNLVGPAYYVSEYHFAVGDSTTNFFSIYPGGLRWHNLKANGIDLVREEQDAQYGGSFVYAGGLFIGSSGNVYDSADFERVGTYPATGPVAADAAANTVAYVSGATLRVFDLAGFSERGQLLLPTAGATVAKVLRCGADQLAISTSTNLLLVHVPFIPQPAPADLSVWQTPSDSAPVGGALTYSITVSNAGPCVATNVSIIDRLPLDAALISAVSPQGVWSTTNGLLQFPLAPLASQAAVTVQVTVQPLTPGQLVSSTWITGDGLNPANGASRLTNDVVFGAALPAVTRLRLNSDALVYDASRDLLWVSTRRFGGAIDHSLRSVRVSTGQAGPAIPLGYPSGLIALSANQNYLYAAYVNDQDALNYTPDNYIRRANLVANVIDEEFPVVDTENQQHAAVDMTGIAGWPSAILVARSGPQRDIALYQDAVVIRRSPSDTGPGKLEPNSAVPTCFYRLVPGYAGGNLDRLNISDTGIDRMASADLFTLPPMTSITPADIKFAAGLLFSDTGIVADPEAMVRVAQLPVAGLVRPDPANGLVFYLAANNEQWTLTALDQHTLAPVWSCVVPDIIGKPTHLVQCGPGRLAFRTAKDQLFLLNTAQLPQQLAADAAVKATANASSVTTNIAITFTATITNAGPAPALSVLLTNQFPPEALILGITSSQGTFTNRSNQVVAALGDLPAGGQAWVQVIATLTHEGVLTNGVQLSAATPDSLPANNAAEVSVAFGIIRVSDLAVAHLPLIGAGSGSNLVCSLVVSNLGPDTATGVVLQEDLYRGGKILGATSSQGTVATSATSLTATLGTLPGGAAAIVTLSILPANGGTVFDEARTSGANQDPNPYNDHSATVFTLGGLSCAEEVPVPAGDLAYDPGQQRLLATLGAAWGSITRSIVSVDLPTRGITPLVNVGNDLVHLALSDNGHYLYTGLADTGGVARIDLASRLVDLRFPLNVSSAPFGPYTAEDLAVLPGHPTTLAAARGGYVGYYSGVALFDGATQRPDTIELGSGAAGFTMQFVDATNLCLMSPFDFRMVSVTPSGLTNCVPIMAGYGGGLFAVQGGLAFCSNGRVINPYTSTVAATFPATGRVVPDLTNRRVFFLDGMVLKACHAITHAELWSIRFDSLAGSVRQFVSLGTNGVAFSTSGNRLFVVQPSSLDNPAVDLSVAHSISPNPVTAGGLVTCTLTVQNSGPWTAAGVVVSNPLPANAAFVSATSSQGSCVFTNGAILCALGDCTNGTVATVTLTLTPLSPGTLTNIASVLTVELDTNPADNTASAGVAVKAQPTVLVRDATVVQPATGKAAIGFTFSLSAASTVPVFVGFQTANGTAVAGQDYDATNGVITLAAGTTTRVCNFNIINNNSSVDPLEFFYLNFPSVTNGTLVRTQAMGAIVKRVFQSLSVTGATVAARSSGPTNVLFKLTLNPTSSLPASVNYQTVGGSALPGTDFAARAGTLQFSPGTSNLWLSVPVFSAPFWQPAKSFALLLSDPQGAMLAVDEAPATILNGNPVPALAVLTPPRSRVVSPGAWVAFSVEAVGNPLPLSYQWSLNGATLAGATASILTLSNVQPAQAGIYTVAVANAAGATTNASAGLAVWSTLSYTVSGLDLVLTWHGVDTLQSATSILGPFADLPGAASPYKTPLADEQRRYFRLRSTVLISGP